MSTQKNPNKSNGLKLYADAYQAEIDENTKQYDTQRQALDADKKSQQNMASITKAKLEKYLPYQMKAQGLSNTGASESTLLQANNNYMNTMADIASNHSKLNNDLALQQSKDVAAINEKFAEKEAATSLENYTLYDGKVQEMLERYADENGKLSESEMTELKNYIEDKSDQLTEVDKARLLSSLDGYKQYTEDEQEAIDLDERRAANKSDEITIDGDESDADDTLGDDFTVKYGDTSYYVERGNEVTDEDDAKEIDHAYGAAPYVGASVVYNGKVYMYLNNNNTGKKNWVEIQGEDGDEESFKELCKALGITAYDRKSLIQAAVEEVRKKAQESQKAYEEVIDSAKNYVPSNISAFQNNNNIT